MCLIEPLEGFEPPTPFLGTQFRKLGQYPFCHSGMCTGKTSLADRERFELSYPEGPTAFPRQPLYHLSIHPYGGETGARTLVRFNTPTALAKRSLYHLSTSPFWEGAIVIAHLTIQFHLESGITTRAEGERFELLPNK